MKSSIQFRARCLNDIVERRQARLQVSGLLCSNSSLTKEVFLTIHHLLFLFNFLIKLFNGGFVLECECQLGPLPLPWLLSRA